ncbi:MAG: prolyl oligopeptidase family serine peptidase [Pseudomonadota bacterium]
MSKLLFLVYLLIFSPIVFATQLLPVEHFAKHGDYLDLKLSPNGEHLAARIRKDGRAVAVFIRLSDMKALSVVNPGDQNEVIAMAWASDERLIYTVAEKTYFIDAPTRTGELFAVNVDGKKHTLLYGYRAGEKQTGTKIKKKETTYATHQVLNILPNDKRHILIIEYPWDLQGNRYYDLRNTLPHITQLNIYNGRKRKVETLPWPGAKAFANDKGEVLFASWVDKNSKEHGAWRSNPKAEWQTLNEILGFGQDLLPIAVNKDGSKAYLSGSTLAGSLKTVFELTLKDGQHRQLFDHTEVDLHSWIRDLDGDEPVIGISYPGQVAYHYAADNDNPIVKYHKMLRRALKGQHIDIVGRTRDGDKLLIHASSDINPGEYFIFDTKTKGADMIMANQSWIDPLQMRPMQAIQLKSRDGMSLNGYLTLPQAQDSEGVKTGFPMVVLPHGGPHYIRDYWEYDNEVQLFANRGYAVLQVNFRGSGGYGEKFQSMGYRQWGGEMINDIIDTTQWAINEGHTEADKICIYGASYGGYAALMAAIRAPDLYQCTVGYVGVYSLEDMYAEGDIRKAYFGKGYLEKVLGRDPKVLREFSPFYHARRIKAAVMLIHGGSDFRVPPLHAEKMRDSLEKVGKKPVWLFYDRGGHGVWDEDDRKELYGELLKFLDKHLK